MYNGIILLYKARPCFYRQNCIRSTRNRTVHYERHHPPSRYLCRMQIYLGTSALCALTMLLIENLFFPLIAKRVG